MSLVTADHGSFSRWAPLADAPDDWRLEAKCRGHWQAFLYADADAYMRCMCQACPVSEECFEDAIRDLFAPGFRAGTNEAERNRIREERARETRRKARIRSCAFCTEEFVTYSWSARYCGEVCRNEGRRKKWREHKREARVSTVVVHTSSTPITDGGS